MSNALVALEAINARIVEIYGEKGLDAPQDYIITGVDVGVPGLYDGCASLASGMTGMSAVDNFPQTALSGCGTRPAYTLRVGVYRCAPVGGDGDAAEPDKAEIEANTADVVRDAHIIYCGIRDALRKEGFDYVMQTWVPVGPAGAISGGHWTVLVDSERDD